MRVGPCRRRLSPRSRLPLRVIRRPKGRLGLVPGPARGCRTNQRRLQFVVGLQQISHFAPRDFGRGEAASAGRGAYTRPAKCAVVTLVQPLCFVRQPLAGPGAKSRLPLRCLEKRERKPWSASGGMPRRPECQGRSKSGPLTPVAYTTDLLDRSRGKEPISRGQPRKSQVPPGETDKQASGRRSSPRPGLRSIIAVRQERARRSSVLHTTAP
jgi:hypothetical protein